MTALEDAFTRIKGVSDRMKTLGSRLLRHSPATCSSPPPVTPLPAIHLPDPPRIYSTLLSYGIKSALAHSIEDSYLLNGRLLKDRCEAKIRETFASLTQMPYPRELLSARQLHEKTAKLQRKVYLDFLKNWEEKAIDTAKAYAGSSNLQSTTGARRRTPFNQDYVPMLEYMLHHNPFPSHADKVFLAKKSGMTYKQIHVWFQNHRSRSRRPERESSKEFDGHMVMSFDHLIERLGDRVVPESQRATPVDSDASEYEWQEECSDEEKSDVSESAIRDNIPDPFPICAPSYAFPSVYPPACHIPPTSARDLPLLPLPVWPRSPAVNAPPPGPCDIEELCGFFSCMTLRGGQRRRLVKKGSDGMRESQKWQSSPVHKVKKSPTVNSHAPIVAPLPSLVRTIDSTSAPSHTSAVRDVTPIPKKPNLQPVSTEAFPISLRDMTPSTAEKKTSPLSNRALHMPILRHMPPAQRQSCASLANSHRSTYDSDWLLASANSLTEQHSHGDNDNVYDGYIFSNPNSSATSASVADLPSKSTNVIEACCTASPCQNPRKRRLSLSVDSAPLKRAKLLYATPLEENSSWNPKSTSRSYTSSESRTPSPCPGNYRPLSRTLSGSSSLSSDEDGFIPSTPEGPGSAVSSDGSNSLHLGDLFSVGPQFTPLSEAVTSKPRTQITYSNRNVVTL